jgi:hypothetical protein
LRYGLARGVLDSLLTCAVRRVHSVFMDNDGCCEVTSKAAGASMDVFGRAAMRVRTDAVASPTPRHTVQHPYPKIPGDALWAMYVPHCAYCTVPLIPPAV